MSDVFVSYKREDKPLAERCVKALKNAGFSVWWDDDITPKGAWDDSIEAAINEARAVIVLWTTASVSSFWVRTEAHFANERNKLVPVRFEGCELPLAFKLAQTAELVGWTGDETDPQWRKTMTWVQQLVAAQPDSEGGSFPSEMLNTYGYTRTGEIVYDGMAVSERSAGGTYFKDGPDLPLMCVIPRGSFTMGSPESEVGRRASEGPIHTVTFAKPFAIGASPITLSEYGSLGARATDPTLARKGDARPAINVSWREAREYLAELSAIAEFTYRLPTEAEWEYSCRAGSVTPFNHGHDLPLDGANFCAGPDVQPFLHPVGSFEPNNFGLYDMHGGVREWVADAWHDDYVGAPMDGLAWTSGRSAMRVLRGGGWTDDAWFLRSAARGRAAEQDQAHFIGFRAARSLEQSAVVRSAKPAAPPTAAAAAAPAAPVATAAPARTRAPFEPCLVNRRSSGPPIFQRT